MNKTTFKNELLNKGYLVFTNKGVSMMPLLRQDRDLMIIKRKEEGQLKNHDAVLFLRGNGQYVMHRILKVRENDYWIVGDNCVSGEYIKEDQIIGILTGVVRDGKTISVDDRLYRFYVWLWCDFYPIRFFLLRCKSLLFRVLSKIKRLLKKILVKDGR